MAFKIPQLYLKQMEHTLNAIYIMRRNRSLLKSKQNSLAREAHTQDGRNYFCSKHQVFQKLYLKHKWSSWPVIKLSDSSGAGREALQLLGFTTAWQDYATTHYKQLRHQCYQKSHRKASHYPASQDAITVFPLQVLCSLRRKKPPHKLWKETRR